MKDRVVAITNLLEAIRFSSTQTSGWTSSKIAEQMVGLHGHMVADTERRRRSRASTAVLAFIEEVAKRRENDPPNPPGTKKKRTKKNAKPGRFHRGRSPGISRRRTSCRAPLCGHSTVMVIHVEGASDTKAQRVQGVVKWNALTSRESKQEEANLFVIEDRLQGGTSRAAS
jgi:hypothetical protein